MEGSIFNQLNTDKQNNLFPAIHFNLVCIFIDSSIENSGFEKQICIVCKEIGDFIGFSKFTGI